MQKYEIVDKFIKFQIFDEYNIWMVSQWLDLKISIIERIESKGNSEPNMGEVKLTRILKVICVGIRRHVSVEVNV